MLTKDSDRSEFTLVSMARACALVKGPSVAGVSMVMSMGCSASDGVLKSTGNSTHDLFNSTMHASSSCEVMSSIPLLLPCCNDSDDVGTGDGKVIETGGDITLTIGRMVVIEGAMAKKTISGGEHGLE